MWWCVMRGGFSRSLVPGLVPLAQRWFDALPKRLHVSSVSVPSATPPPPKRSRSHFSSQPSAVRPPRKPAGTNRYPATPLHRYTLPLAAAKPPVLPNSPLFKTHTSLRLIVSHPARPFMTATPTHNPAGQSRALSEHGRVGTAAGAVHQGRRQPSQGPGAFVVESAARSLLKELQKELQKERAASAAAGHWRACVCPALNPPVDLPFLSNLPI